MNTLDVITLQRVRTMTIKHRRQQKRNTQNTLLIVKMSKKVVGRKSKLLTLILITETEGKVTKGETEEQNFKVKEKEKNKKFSLQLQ